MRKRELIVCAVMGALAGLAGLAPLVCRADLSTCIDATCRVRAGGGTMGSGCVIQRNGQAVLVLTNSHVVAGGRQVTCNFWSAGHESAALAGTVLADRPNIDAALISIPAAAFGGRLPPAVPLAGPDYQAQPGETIMSVGCSRGAWASAWRGHARGYAQDGRLQFVPPPANGRSGSAIFDARGERVVGLLEARNDHDGIGLAIPVSALLGQTKTGARPAESVLCADTLTESVMRAWGRATVQPTQCGPNGCGPQQGPGQGPGQGLGRESDWDRRVFPLPLRDHFRDGKKPGGDGGGAWPTLPLPPAGGLPPVDVSPLDAKLGKIAELLESIKAGQAGAGPALPVPTPAPPGPTTDDVAREAAKAALSAVSEVGRRVLDVEAAAAAADGKLAESVAGVAKQALGAVEKAQGVADAHAKLLTQVEQFGDWKLRHAVTKDEVKERLGENANGIKVEVATLREMLHDRITGVKEQFAGENSKTWWLFGAMAAGIVVVIFLVRKDVGHKQETGDPLVAEKIAASLVGRLGGVPWLGPAVTLGGKAVHAGAVAVEDIDARIDAAIARRRAGRNGNGSAEGDAAAPAATSNGTGG